MEVLLELMGSIKNLPVLDRPREKALRYGLSSLSDAELLAIFIGSGYKDNSVTELATGLLSKYGGIRGLSECSISELKTNKGIKNVRSINLAAIFEINRRIITKKYEEDESIIDGEYLYNKYKHQIIDINQECIFLVMLNAKKKIIYESVLSIGSEDSVLFSFANIYRELVAHNAKYYYLIHNHTNGSFMPSENDLIITKFLRNESKNKKIPLLDHLIISRDGYYSFQKNEKN